VKTIIRKAYFDFENEEKWLNEMSAKGFALMDYTWCRYVFSDCQPGEYIYRLELLENLPNHPVSQKYLRFLEESGVEHIASYMRWVFLRRKASDGAFDIYSDADSRVKHYKRIIMLNLFILPITTLSGLLNVLTGIGAWHSNAQSPFNLYAGIFCTLVGTIPLVMIYRYRKKTRKLRKDRVIME